MDVDKMFKLPSLPKSAGQKRKFTDKPSPEILKKYRPAGEEPAEGSASVVDLNGNGSGSADKGKGRAATVSEEDEEEEDAGYAEADRDEGDDEDGRFFGGGLNDEQEQILDIFDKAGDDDGEATTLTLPALRRQLGRFERTVAKNAEQRGKYPDDPSRFIESESDLDSALKQFLPLTQNPPLFYPELVKSGAVALLANLLSHENSDIAIDVIEIIQELTDEDVGAEVDDLAEGAEEEGGGMATKTRMAMGELIDDLLNNAVLDLLVSNLTRLDETEETDRQGVFHILGVFENLLSFMPPLGEQIVAETTLLPWLLKRIGKKEYDSNKQYASEILSILLQEGRSISLKVAEMGGVDTFLQILARYRKKDPGDAEELEYMENIVNSLCSLLPEPEIKQQFLEAEGVELMVILMKEKLVARSRAIKILSYALQTAAGSANCEKFVQVLGLKSLFPIFMGKSTVVQNKKLGLGGSTTEEDEHILGIIVSLFTNLASDSPERIRLVMKFVESGYEKVERLLELREAAEGRLRSVNKEIAMERKVMEANKEEITEEDEGEWYLRRTDAGLSSLQNADYILAWVAMEDDGALQHAKTLLTRKDQSFQDVITVLEEFRENVGDDEEDGEEGETESESESALQRMILDQLIAFLAALE